MSGWAKPLCTALPNMVKLQPGVRGVAPANRLPQRVESGRIRKAPWHKPVRHRGKQEPLRCHTRATPLGGLKRQIEEQVSGSRAVVLQPSKIPI